MRGEDMSGNTPTLFNSIAAFIIAILSGLGVGSGGLLVAYLTVTGQAGGEVRGTNLLFFIISATAASLLNIRARRLDATLIFIMSACGIAGCLFGTYASSYVTADAVRKIFGGMLVLSGGYVLLSGIPRKKPNSGTLHK